MLKVCSRCGTPKSLDDFPKDKSKRDGRYPVCKLCRSPLANASYAARQPQERTRRKVRYDANPAKFRAESKRFRDHLRATNPEGLREYHRIYYQTHKAQWIGYAANLDQEKVRRRSAAYRAANREKIQARVRDWFRRHPHVSTLASARYRSRLKQVEKTVTPEQLDEILAFFDHQCGYCLVDLRTLPPKLRTWDHMLALVRGGSNSAENVIPCCKPCNSRKKDRSMLLMVQYISAA